MNMVVFVIDNGGQYTHVIWRTVRDLGYEAEIRGKGARYEEIEGASHIILSGGPGSAYKDSFPLNEEIIRKFQRPLLGICLGHQLIAHILGGKVERGKHAEYGIMRIIVDEEDVLFKGLGKEFDAWVSHFDEVKKIPENFKVLAHSEVCEVEAMRHKEKPIFGVQFHPEVWHTENGEKILSNFLSV
jgi:GMP synthase (glutamine-hydrolysing)